MEVCSYSYFQGCGYLWSPCVPLVTTDKLSVRAKKFCLELVSHKLTAYLSVFDLFLTQWIMAILSNGWNFESHNSLKHSFMNIWGLCSNFVKCESFLESNSPDILALYETKLLWHNWFWQLLCEGLSFFIPKVFCYSYTWSGCLCEGKNYFCMGLISRKHYRFLFMFLSGFTSVSYFFFLYQSPSLS